MLHLLSLAAALDLPPEVIQQLERRNAAGIDRSAVVGLHSPEGTVVMAFGARTGAGDDPVQPGDLYEIGSISKTFTAVLLADAVGRGEVALTDRVADLAPSGVKVRGAYTLEQLASHHSGLARLPCNLKDVGGPDPYATFDRAALWKALKVCKLESAPGTTFAYSNYGVGLLGELLAARVGSTWGALVDQRLLNPLAIQGLGWPTPADGLLVEGSNSGQDVAHWTFDALAGAGALRGSVPALLAWGEVHAQVATGRPIQPTVPGAALGPIDDADRARLTAAIALALTPRFDAGEGAQVGLGWFHNPLPGGGEAVWHNGGTAGFHSFVGFHGDRVAAVLVSSGMGADDIGMHLLDPASPLTPLPERTTLADEALAPYLGTWRLQPGFDIVVTATDGHLVVQATGQPAFPVWPDGPDRFRLEVVDAAIAFDRDAAGQITGAWLEQNGRHPLKRVD